MPTTDIRTNSRLRQLINQLVAFVAVLDTDGTLRDVDEAALAIADLERDDVIGKPFWECYWWSFDTATSERIRLDVIGSARGETTRYETVVRTANDGRMPIMFQLGPIRDDDGAIIELIASGTDISREKANALQLEKERERLALLNAELRHRVKNLFASVQATLAISARQADDKDMLLEIARSRISALNSAQDVTLEEGELKGASLESLFDAIALPHAPDAASLHYRGSPVTMDGDAVTPVALILHELALNASKYGAWSEEGGKVDVRWKTKGSRRDRMLEIVWSEMIAHRQQSNVAALERKGFGTNLLERCAQQIGGTLVQEKARDGWITRIEIPMGSA